jgi:hypothetical protein
MSIFYALICFSLALRPSLSLNIHNQCHAINLTSLVYFIHGGKWHVVPDSEIYVNDVMRNRLKFNSGQDIFEGALAYKIQHTESTRNESKSIWLLVAWHGEHRKGLHVRASVVERNKRLDEDRLRKLYQKHWPLLKEQSKSKWELNNTTKLETTIKLMNGGYRWDIFISEEKK